MATAPASVPAPWRSLFQEHISKMEDPYMAVSTVARHPTTGKPVPRVRYCGFRSFFGELKLHPSAEKQLEEQNDKNPAVFESDMLSFTTDVRMEKVGHLADFNGAIEVVFFVKETMTQWRVSGTAFVIGDAADQEHEQYARREIQKGLRRRQRESNTHYEKQWTWEKEVTMYFANHSPVMRGTFKSPPPGHPITEENPDPTNLKPGQEITDLHDPVARKYFRVVVIRVEEVDQLDLADHKSARRWKWNFVGDGQWEEVEVWP